MIFDFLVPIEVTFVGQTHFVVSGINGIEYFGQWTRSRSLSTHSDTMTNYVVQRTNSFISGTYSATRNHTGSLRSR